MKNIEYLLKKEYELKHIKETTPLCKICYKSKYKINCSNACHSCEFNKFVDVLNFLNRDYYQEYEISQYDYDVLDCVRSTNLIYKKSRFKDFEMLVRMKEKGHFKNINKNVLIKDLLKRLVIKDIDYDVKQQRIKQKNEDDEMTAEEMFEKLSYREVKTELTTIYKSPNDLDIIFYELTKSYAINSKNKPFNILKISIEVHNAINQKLKELGWLNK